MASASIRVSYTPNDIDGLAAKIEKTIEDFDPEQRVSDFINDFALDINLPGGDLYLTFNGTRLPVDTSFEENGINGNGELLELFSENIPA
ncbi:hypothetical protein TRFO_37877 [Tritrichomonas foetus]|uniref:Ubiquitin-like domain-containing protein n=1 Tax=Tritrichomonas foetus TaxID=1144522 RepID=A0A1J4JFH8_9EUKA|nr:hypothetical protein TRFO_37877 [Tritrichomonas foetus]|eukprot:OHS95980.1 hypothetical protein TRFO_37877 [Tritrichomonas foetus]